MLKQLTDKLKPKDETVTYSNPSVQGKGFVRQTLTKETHGNIT